VGRVMMRTRAVIAIGLMTLSLTACGSSDSPAPPTPIGNPPGTWQLKFDDEFNGQSLNGTDWSTGWLSQGITQPVSTNELECYDPANVKVSDGSLILGLAQKSESCGGMDRSYASGMVNSDGKFEFRYGFMEARIWLPGQGQQIANWPAFWADGQDWPEDGEIDVMEGLGGRACWHLVYLGGNPGGCADGAFVDGWHTFGADWEPNSIIYYYDGQVAGKVESGVTSAPVYLVINYAIANTIGGPAQVPATMRIDYVRVWQHTG
jgi:beta-glucanase (GH16 family)